MNTIKSAVVFFLSMFVAVAFAQQEVPSGSVTVEQKVPQGVLSTNSTDPFEVRMKTNDTTPATVAKRKEVTRRLLEMKTLRVDSFIVIGATGQQKDVTYHANVKDGTFDFFFDTSLNTLCQRGGVAAKYYMHEDGWLIIEMLYKEKNPLWDCEQQKMVFDPLTGAGRLWVAPKNAVTAAELKPGRQLKLVIDPM